MKTFKLIALAAFAGVALMFATASAQASGASISLNITNVISSNAPAIIGYPTNTVGQGPVILSYTTNGSTITTNYNLVGYATGNGVPCFNQEHIGVNFQGYASVSNAASVSFTFVTSMANNTPAQTTGTNWVSQNVTNLTSSDWAAPVTASNPGVVTVVIPIAAGTNYINWQTNFPMNGSIFQDANFLGVYAISNTITGTGYITNTTLLVNRKLIPTPLIGQ